MNRVKDLIKIETVRYMNGCFLLHTLNQISTKSAYTKPSVLHKINGSVTQSIFITGSQYTVDK